MSMKNMNEKLAALEGALRWIDPSSPEGKCIQVEIDRTRSDLETEQRILTISREAAQRQLQGKLAEMKALLNECYNIADLHGFSFVSPIGEYGMGGTYQGAWNAHSEQPSDTWWSSEDTGWQSSSRSC